MIIFTKEPTSIPFLLVDGDLAGVVVPVNDIIVQASFQGYGFLPLEGQLIRSLDSGWYMLDGMTFDEPGVLIVEAYHVRAAHKWRDIHQVMDRTEFELVLGVRPIRLGVSA